MSPSSIRDAEAFTQTVLLPAFTEIRNLLVDQGHSVVIASTILETDSVAELLVEMCPEALHHDATEPRLWIDHYLSVITEVVPDATNPDASLIGHYCLSVQFAQLPDQIGITPLCAYRCSSSEYSPIHLHTFSDRSFPQNIHDIEAIDITDYFLESFDRFETDLLDRSLAPKPLEPAKPPAPLELAPPPTESLPEPEPSQALPTCFDLAQRIQLLTQQLSTAPFPTFSKLNRSLATGVQIRPVHDRYGRSHDLILDYSPQVSEADLVEYFTRLSYYQTLKSDTFQHGHLMPRLDAWFKQYGQPRSGAIASHLRRLVADHRQCCYDRLASLLQTQLEEVSAQSLHQELIELQQAHQYQRMLLERLENSPLWGYLDSHRLVDSEAFQRQYPQILQSLDNDPTERQNSPEPDAKTSWNQFLTQYYFSSEEDRYTLHPIAKNTVTQLILSQSESSCYHLTEADSTLDFAAQYLKDKGGQVCLKLIESGDSKQYKAYRKKHPRILELNGFVEYVVTQKLYPKRPVFVRNTSDHVYPRLERWWCSSEATPITPNPFAQVWCVYPMKRTDLAHWLIIAATTGTQPLNTIELNNGKMAAEGTVAYLGQMLEKMMQCEDELPRRLSHHLTEALGRGGVKYSHLHQEWNFEADEVGDIIQLQFQLVA
jgi:hypothetical protein